MPDSYMASTFSRILSATRTPILRRTAATGAPLRIVALVVLTAVCSQAQVSFYVDSSRTTEGTGTAASPWRNWGSIPWTTIYEVLATSDVNIYFSSRDTWSFYDSFKLQSTVGSGKRLTLIGDEQYNLLDSGVASWQAESTGSRARLTGASGNGGQVLILPGSSYIGLKGFYVFQPTWGGINLGTAKPTLNTHNILVENCVVDSPKYNHGIWFGYAEAGCHSVTIRSCLVTNSPLEAIYIGHYSYLNPTITNVVVEGNTVVNCGVTGEGDIDIKPSVKGAVIRNNTIYSTLTSTSGSSCGIVVYSSDCQIYGNTIYAQRAKTTDWGFGIYLTSDGDGAGNGVPVANTLIYNNLIYANARSGIKISANTSTVGASVSNTRVWNNTIHGNGRYGIQASASGIQRVVITEFFNNILSENSLHDIYFQGGATIVAADSNLYYRLSGSSWWYGAELSSMDQWKALGFDRAGYTDQPGFVDISRGDFNLLSPTSALSGGTPASFFSDDMVGRKRVTVNWALGPLEPERPKPAGNLRVASGTGS